MSAMNAAWPPVSRAFVVLILLSFLTLSLYPVVRADGDADGDGIGDDIETSTQRTVVAKALPVAWPESFFVKSRSVGAETNDAFELLYERGEFQFTYMRHADSDEASLKFSLRLESLIEFSDKNGNGSFDAGESVKTLDLENAVFLPLSYESVPAPDGEIQHVFTIETGETLSHILRVTVIVTNSFTRIQGRLITPMEVKLELSVSDFPFNEIDTKLAISFELESSSTMRLETPSFDQIHFGEQEEEQVNVTAGKSFAFFSWSREVTVDGAQSPVFSSSKVVGDKEIELYLAYPRGSLIVHDPKIGVMSDAFYSILNRPPEYTPRGDFPLFIISLAVLAVTVSVTVVLRRKRRE